ncbi:MAG TPA: right-handed parallel beta-helix repeat-containing protein [Thermoanaerobaculia bacterium]|nr:right-handed parallel beta-helix repeat-containing protein [Thermoanaerobaculia bacterium]
MRSKIAVLSFIVLACTAESQAGSWFVSPSGNDAAAGTLAAPFRTITKAASMTRPGDVVEVRGGVYPESVSIAAKGTASAPVTIRAYAGEQPVIDGSTTATDSNLVTLANAAHVVFSGFEVRNAKRAGICLYPANFVTIASNSIHHSERNGIYIGSTSSDVTLEGNTVSNNVLHNRYHTMTGGWSQAIGVKGTRIAIRGNRVYENDGEGIAVILSDDVTVEKNEVRDNFSVGIYLDNAQTTRVDANLVFSSGNTRYYRDGHPAAGIGTANESYSTSNPLDGLKITNNIVVRAKWGFYYSNEESGGGLRNTVVANNTFHAATHTLLFIAAGTHTGTIVQNNIFSQNGAAMTSIAGTGLAFRANNWYGGAAGAAAGAGDAIGDPRFMNAGGSAAGDFRIRTGSSAAASGVDLNTLLTTDYFGSARGRMFDIGAHQLTSSTAATSDATPPTAPGNLQALIASPTSIALRWTASTDDTGVTGYRVYRRGALVATVGTTSYTDGGLVEGTSYSYQVFALDAAGNVSEGSWLVSIAPAGSSEPEPPSNSKKKSRTTRH